MSSKKIICASVIVLSCFCCCCAEEPLSIELEKIVVTPLNSGQPYSEISRNMEVVDYSTPRLLSLQTIADPLDKLTSVYTTDYGTVGATKDIHIRGSSAEQVLIMVDSRPINNPRTGMTELYQISPDTIERVEVIKGPASSVYGSSAIGGVVNVITKKPSEKPSTTIVSSFGTFRTFHESLSTSATFKGLGYRINYAYDSSSGDRDNSGYLSNNWDAKLNYEVAEGNNIYFNGGYFQNRAGAPGSVFFPQVDDCQRNFNNFLDMGWDAKIFDDANMSIRGYQNSDRLEFTEGYDPLMKTASRTTVRGIVAKYDQTFFDVYKVIAGFDGKDNRMNSSNSGKHRYVVRSPFVQNEVSLWERVFVNFGARWDDYSNFKSEPTQSAGLSLKAHDYVKLRANYAKGFRAPTFSELYWPFDGWTEGNPRLVPEKSWSWEGGLDIDYPCGLGLSATYYTNKVKDLINWAPGSDWVWRPSNVSSAKIDGWEFSSDIPLLKHLKADIGYTYMNAMDRELDRYLIYRPKHKVDLGLTCEYEK
ncbi:MAG TPA: TonB-dependent receptor, partial [Candidatus Omnitrophota bacterium]|nr:TonB-dependent receptor [Candidatus Omnitrophota bacterium]